MDIQFSECNTVSPLTFETELPGHVAIPNMAVPGQYIIVYQPSSVTTAASTSSELPLTSLQLTTPDNTAFPISIVNCSDYDVLEDSNLEDVTQNAKRIKLETTTVDAPSSMTDDNLQLPQDSSTSATTHVKEEFLFDCSSFQSDDNHTPTTTRSRSLASSDCDIGDYRSGDPLYSLLSTPPNTPQHTSVFFDELQTSLAEEFKGCIIPSSLFSLVPNRPDIPTREQKLHVRFNKLSNTYPDAIHQLSGFYKYQSALIETERFRTLHGDMCSKSYTNSHFDDEIHDIIDRVEKSVSLLEEADMENKRTVTSRSRPLLSNNAIKLMSDWYNTHLEHPYPDPETIDVISKEGNVSLEQVKKWFANKRNRSCNTKRQCDIFNRKRKRFLVQ